MPAYCVAKVGRALNSRRMALNGSRVLVIGVAYKKNVNDMRESPSLKIIDLLNVDSAVAVLTQDRVRRVAGGFEILGRLPGAPPRGCSLAIDELLGRA